MKNKNVVDMTAKVSERLKSANISFYKIARIIDEPESTIQNIFKGHNKYAEDRIQTIMDMINSYLDEIEKEKTDPSLIFQNDPEVFIRLYKLGLDSKAFTPDEKYQLAVAYKKLTDSQSK